MYPLTLFKLRTVLIAISVVISQYL